MQPRASLAALLALAGAAAVAASPPRPGDWALVDAAEPWAGGALYPSAVSWWGAPAPTASAFAAPLAPWGRFVRHPDLGRVWLPRVTPGWQPYRHGRWVLHPVWGRTWLSDKPFGWAVYHYGRWGFDPRLGWFWVPGLAFAPHWADLRWSARWSDWAPLPPPGWAGGSGWHRAAGGWSHGDPGWTVAPRGNALRPRWQPRAGTGCTAVEPMTSAPAPRSTVAARAAAAPEASEQSGPGSGPPAWRGRSRIGAPPGSGADPACCPCAPQLLAEQLGSGLIAAARR